MMLTKQARHVFEADHFATHTGIEIAHAGDHESLCTLTLADHHRNARQVAMGGVVYTLADFAAAVACNSDSLAKGEELHWVSLCATIHYLSPASGDHLEAHCTALKHGRTTALYQSQIHNPDNGKLVAVVETTMARI